MEKFTKDYIIKHCCIFCKHYDWMRGNTCMLNDGAINNIDYEHMGLCDRMEHKYTSHAPTCGCGE